MSPAMIGVATLTAPISSKFSMSCPPYLASNITVRVDP